jgi:hypothetical protein
MNDDRSFTVDGAFVFTDAATGALLFFDNGPFLVITHDRLIGTLFIANKADLIRIPGNTPCFIDMGNPDLKEAFFFNRHRPDRLSGANPPAKIAEFLTVSDSWNQSRRVKASKACFQKCGLKRIVWTDLQTFPAPCANRDEFFFRQGPWRTDQPVILQAAL